MRGKVARRLSSGMPELAEVEFYRKQWDCGVGSAVRAVQIHAAKRIFRGTDTDALVKQLSGRKLIGSEAHGKQMLFRFSGSNFVGLHLGMSGTLRVEPARFTPAAHDHFVLRQAKRALVFRDPRLFGRVRFHHGNQEPSWWKNGGPAIASAEFDRAFFDGFLQRHRKAPIKAVLLLQHGFAGVGNWMADEILWRAGVVPRKRAGSLGNAEIAALYRATRFVSREALRIIGSDWSDPPATWLLNVRWKAGGECPRDGKRLHRAQIGGRTTAWCPKCQRA